jgi:predicted DNA-binding transcriptional regulator YafY
MAASGKQGSEKTLLRRMRLLDKLPADRGPDDGLTIAQLTDYLNANGYACTRRTVERDLQAMHDAGTRPEEVAEWRDLGVHLACHATANGTKRWSHAATSKAVLLKALGSDDALLLSLLEQEMKYFLPASVYASLGRYLEPTRRVLSLPSNQRASTFHTKFRVIADASLQGPPAPDIAHLHEINEALLRQEQLDMAYCSSQDRQVKDYRLHPVGLVKQGLFHWLLAVKHDKALGERSAASVQTFRVNRIVTVSRRQQESVARGLPTLDAALENGALQFFDTGKIALRLRFAPGRSGDELCENYREAPLSQDQQIAPGPDGAWELRATVHYSRQLVWMLQGQANLLRVEEPASVKAEIDRFLETAVTFQA